MKGIPREMLMMILRHGMTAVGFYLVASGKLTQDDGELFAGYGAEILGGVVGLLGLGWSAKRKADRARRAEPVDPAMARGGAGDRPRPSGNPKFGGGL